MEVACAQKSYCEHTDNIRIVAFFLRSVFRWLRPHCLCAWMPKRRHISANWADNVRRRGDARRNKHTQTHQTSRKRDKGRSEIRPKLIDVISVIMK